MNEHELSQTRCAPRSRQEPLHSSPMPEFLWDHQSMAGLGEGWVTSGPPHPEVWSSRLDLEGLSSPQLQYPLALLFALQSLRCLKAQLNFAILFFSTSVDDFRAKAALSFDLTSLESCF